MFITTMERARRKYNAAEGKLYTSKASTLTYPPTYLPTYLLVHVFSLLHSYYYLSSLKTPYLNAKHFFPRLARLPELRPNIPFCLFFECMAYTLYIHTYTLFYFYFHPHTLKVVM